MPNGARYKRVCCEQISAERAVNPIDVLDVCPRDHENVARVRWLPVLVEERQSGGRLEDNVR
jgi:hypothetical protein